MSNLDDRSQAARTRDLVNGYYGDPAARRVSVRSLFNRLAQYYDGVNMVFSLGSGAWYRRFCLRNAGVRPGLRIVDVAVGTGLLAREAVALTGDPSTIIGVDISEAMLAIAQKNLGIMLVQAAGEMLPLAADSADMVTMGYALRHIADLTAVLAEALRVLRPGGTLVLLEVSAPHHRLGRALAWLLIGGVMPLFSLLTTRDRRAHSLMRYHWATIVKYMPPEVITDVLKESGFQDVSCATELGLFHCHTARKALD
jgi:demethylmenaquinone methyltransferase/2-methoxy-6-polyprenyl-1,4-benzoquinol methylase